MPAASEHVEAPPPGRAWVRFVPCLVVMLLCGLAAAYVYHWLGFDHRFGRWFKVLVLLPLGGVGVGLVRLCGGAHRWVYPLAAAGAVPVIAGIHLFEYRDFPDRWADLLFYKLAEIDAEERARELGELVSLGEKNLDAVKELVKRTNPGEVTPDNQKLLKTMEAKLTKPKEELEKNGRLAEKSRDFQRRDWAARGDRTDFGRNIDPLVDRYRADRGIAPGQRLLGDDKEAWAAWLKGLSFADYLSLRAEQGVVVYLFWDIRLGYRGSFAYWLFEFALATGLLILEMIGLRKAWEQADRKKAAAVVPAAGDLTPTDPTRCPNCGFASVWDGAKCTHCGYQAAPPG